MGFLNRFFNKEKNGQTLKLVTEKGNGFYNFDGRLYESDIIRSCIRPQARAVGKLIGKHVRQTKDGIVINPDVYMRFLLEEPNPYMTGQMFQEKMATQLELNNNAFAWIIRNENGYATQLYPLVGYGVQAKYKASGELYLSFSLNNGEKLEVDYTDIIHLRQDFNENDIFGDSPARAIIPLMTVVSTMDQGIVKAIRNSSVVRWLMKFKTPLRPEDVKLNIKEFTETYLDIDSEYGGVVGSDTKYDLEQVDTNSSFIANAAQMRESTTRIYNFYGTNEKIVQNKWNEDEWNSYYEGRVEPVSRQFAGEYTRKLFTRKERGFGNSVIFDASNLAYASMSTKLQLVQMVDRGAMTPDEWRSILNLGPIEGGNKPIRRLDTAVVDEGGENNDED